MFQQKIEKKIPKTQYAQGTYRCFGKITNLLIIREKKNSKIGVKSTPRRHKVPENAILDLLIFNKLRKKTTKN